MGIYKSKNRFHGGVAMETPFPCDVCKQIKEKTTLTFLNKMLICQTCLPAYHDKLSQRNRDKKLRRRKR